MTNGNKYIEDQYHELYQSEDKEGRRMLTSTVNALLATMPSKTLAMALMLFLRDDKPLSKLLGIDKSKVDARTKSFMEFFESQGVTFIDATPPTEEEKDSEEPDTVTKR